MNLKNYNIKIKTYSINLIIGLMATLSLCAQNTQLDWVQVFGANSDIIEEVIDIVIKDDNMYVFGEYKGSIDFDSSANEAIHVAYDPRFYIEKRDLNGNFLWHKDFKEVGLSASLNFVDFAVDNQGNVTIIGSCTRQFDIDTGPGVEMVGNNDPQELGKQFVVQFDTDGNINWKQYRRYTSIKDIAVDANGTIYIIGSFLGTVDFDTSSSTNAITSYFDGTNNIINPYFLTLNGQGQFIDVQTMATDYAPNKFESIHTDVFGNIYVLGVFRGSIDADFSTAVHTMTAEGIEDNPLILKLNNQRNFVWARKLFGGHFRSFKMTNDTVGNIVLGGSFGGTVDFNPNAGVHTISSLTNYNAFVTKWTSNGDFLWANAVSDPNYTPLSNITMDVNNNIYFGGFFTGTADFDGGAAVANYTVPSGRAYAYLNKLKADGSYDWTTVVESSHTTNCRAVAVHSNNDIYLGGHFSGTADFDPNTGVTNTVSHSTYYGYTDAFLLKYRQPALSTATNTFPKPIRAYPNPNSTATISIDLHQVYSNIKIKLTDLSGRIIQEQVVLQGQRIAINSPRATGMYVLHVQSEHKKAIIKIIKN